MLLESINSALVFAPVHGMLNVYILQSACPTRRPQSSLCVY